MTKNCDEKESDKKDAGPKKNPSKTLTNTTKTVVPQVMPI